MLFGLPGLLLCLFAIGAQASLPQAPAQQPDASGVYTPGGFVELPQVKKEWRPNYTAEALGRGIHGVVWVEVVVMPDGKVGKAAVTRSLDKVYGLDQEALKAARKWQFKPGRRFGAPVPVRVTIELTFAIRDRPSR